jgi:hypothetical protein
MNQDSATDAHEPCSAETTFTFCSKPQNSQELKIKEMKYSLLNPICFD